jgi:hypothetical protein
VEIFEILVISTPDFGGLKIIQSAAKYKIPENSSQYEIIAINAFMVLFLKFFIFII